LVPCCLGDKFFLLAYNILLFLVPTNIKSNSSISFLIILQRNKHEVKGHENLAPNFSTTEAASEKWQRPSYNSRQTVKTLICAANNARTRYPQMSVENIRALTSVISCQSVVFLFFCKIVASYNCHLEIVIPQLAQNQFRQLAREPVTART